MRALGHNLIIDEIPEVAKKTKGGLLLNELVREDIRYRRGTVISLGEQIDILKVGEVVLFDKASGQKIAFADEEYKVIMLRDVVAVE